MISIHLVAENNLTAAIEAFKSFCGARNEVTQNLRGSFSVAHNGDIAADNKLIAQYQKAFPVFKFITITSENTGIVEELTHAFKTAHQYFSESETEKHFLATTIQFKVFIGTEYFLKLPN
jgi:hypothetical protein